METDSDYDYDDSEAEDQSMDDADDEDYFDNTADAFAQQRKVRAGLANHIPAAVWHVMHANCNNPFILPADKVCRADQSRHREAPTGGH